MIEKNIRIFLLVVIMGIWGLLFKEIVLVKAVCDCRSIPDSNTRIELASAPDNVICGKKATMDVKVYTLYVEIV